MDHILLGLLLMLLVVLLDKLLLLLDQAPLLWIWNKVKGLDIQLEQ